jgi:hypothetical protein
MNELFGPFDVGINQMAIVVQKLFQPLPAVAEQLDAFVLRHFFKDGERSWVVGIHARTTESYAHNPKHLDLFLSCALEQAAPAIANGRKVVFFLATDSENSQRTLRAALEPTAPVVVASDELQDSYGLRVFDYYLLLSACDDLVVTVGSSFSRLASVRADVAPAFITFNSTIWNLVHPPDECRRGLTARPCSMRYQWHRTMYTAECIKHDEETLRFLREECDVH